MLFAVTMFGRRRMASVIFAVSPSISNSNSSNFQNQQKRTIYSKYAVPEYAKNMPPPWPYKERGYRTFHQFLDFGFSKRMGENSKLIIVEGNTGSGKSKFAAELADELGFYHIPDPKFDEIAFIDSYGDDRRLHYHLLPETCWRFDTRMFYEHPRHRNVARMQLERLECRTEAYMNALAHIMNTGQGVVLEKHYQSDKAYVEAMYNKGYLSDPFRWHYHKWLFPLIEEELRVEAHCVIYLDCPVSKCLENIKKYHKPWEWQNEVMDYTYLEDLEKGLKKWLKDYSRHAEILTYDWSNGGDARKVAEDLEQVDLDDFRTHENEKFETWELFEHEDHKAEFRRMVTSNKWDVLQWFYYRPAQVEELWCPLPDMLQRNQVYDMLYGSYAAGYKADRGDDVTDMVLGIFRENVGNKKWSEYLIRDEHHFFFKDQGFYTPDPPETPTISEEMLEPQSPYKTDGGCLASAELFLNDLRVPTRFPHH